MKNGIEVYIKKINIICIIKLLSLILLVFFLYRNIKINLINEVCTRFCVTQCVNSEIYDEIAPGGNCEYKISEYLDTFNILRFFAKGEQKEPVEVTLSYLTTGENYKTVILDVERFVYDEENDITSIETIPSDFDLNQSRFDTGEYILTIHNISDDSKIAIAKSKDNPDLYPNTSEEDIPLILCINTVKITEIGKYIGMLIIGIVFCYLAIILCTYKRLSVYSFFLVSATFLTLIYMVLFLPWATADAWVHYGEMYRYSNIFSGFDNGDNWIGRAEDTVFVSNIWWWGNGHEPTADIRGYSSLINSFSMREVFSGTGDFPYHSKKLDYYSVFNYLPEVIGLIIARTIHLGAVPTIYFARILLLICYVSGCFHALKRTPIGKFIFSTIPLLPICLMLSSAFSYDGIVLIVTLNFIANIIALKWNPDSKKIWIECMTWIFLIGAVKGGGYLVLLPLVVLLFDKVDIKRSLKHIASILTCGIGSVVLFDILLPQNKHLYQFGYDGNGYMATSFVWKHPLQYITMWINTVIKEIGEWTMNLTGAYLGWLEPIIPLVVPLAIVVVAIVISFFEQDLFELDIRAKRIFIFTVIITIFTTPMMLLSWTPEGYSYIAGVQGRYFLPILPLMLLCITKYKLHVINVGRENESDGDASEKTKQSEISIINNGFLIIALLSALSVFYIAQTFLGR